MRSFIYVGEINSQRVFYCPEDKQAYLETISGAAEYRKSLPIIGATAGGIGMVVLRRWGDYGFSASMVPFVFFSMLIGLVAAFLLVKQVRKTENTGQGRWTPVDKLDAESMKKFLWQSRKMSLIYFLAKAIVLLLVIFAPFVIEGTGSFFMAVCYPLLWMCLGYLWIYFRPGKRRKGLKGFWETYH
ncbi:MAG: hypothetical protein J5986_01410 [Roseburia sp.]|nr:hypothetical protein [Roseburia sp.]